MDEGHEVGVCEDREPYMVVASVASKGSGKDWRWPKVVSTYVCLRMLDVCASPRSADNAVLCGGLQRFSG
jgi:hypothetical protein